MAGKKRRTQNINTPPKAEAPFAQPFKSLETLKHQLVRQEKKAADLAAKAKQTPPPPPPPPSDETLFALEMADVTPLTSKDKYRPKADPPLASAWKIPEMPNEDLEALQTLSDLVSGKTEFDLTYSDEYVEGQTKGLPPSIMTQLRAGRIPYQDYLDLHGLTLLQAEAAVTRFILDAISLGRTCVLLIHGRGLGSQDGIPVLKRFLEAYLLRGAPRKYILAFTTAQPIDGGLGASYILLRRTLPGPEQKF